MKHKPGYTSEPKAQLVNNSSGKLVEVLACDCGATGIREFIPPHKRQKQGREEVRVESES
jgi:hypothetical protein